MQKQQIDRSDCCSVLVISCGKYRDLWTPFFVLFRKYWPDCDMPVFLGTNSYPICFDRVSRLAAAGDETWSKQLRFCLESITSDYVLLLLEDFFLDRPVSTSEVRNYLQVLQSLDGVMLRLFPNPPADYWRGGIGVIHSRAAFRVSLQSAIWNRLRLLELLVDDESPWDFEVRGSRRSRALPAGFYCAANAVIHYQHVIERGEWFSPAARTYKASDIGCDFGARPVMSLFKSWRKKQANRLRRLMTRVHSRWICIRYPETV